MIKVTMRKKMIGDIFETMMMMIVKVTKMTRKMTRKMTVKSDLSKFIFHKKSQKRN